MLRKSQNDKGSPLPVSDFAHTPPQSAPAPSPSPSPARSSSQSTVIGEHISIEGDIKGSEDLVIEGTVKGSVHLPECHLTIGSKGQVEAEINAANVTISGRLTGNIQAKGKVEITKEADFTGEIKARRISVEDGAYLKASIELVREGSAAIGGPSMVSSMPKPAATPGPGDQKES